MDPKRFFKASEAIGVFWLSVSLSLSNLCKIHSFGGDINCFSFWKLRYSISLLRLSALLSASFNASDTALENFRS